MHVGSRWYTVISVGVHVPDHSIIVGPRHLTRRPITHNGPLALCNYPAPSCIQSFRAFYHYKLERCKEQSASFLQFLKTNTCPTSRLMFIVSNTRIN